MTFPFRAVQEEGKRPSAVRESRDVVAWSSESDPVCTALEKANNNNNKKQTKKDFVFFFHRPSRFLAKSGGLPAVTCSSRSYRGANHGHLITPGSAHQSVEGENLDPKSPITLFFNVHHLLWDVPVFFHTKYEKERGESALFKESKNLSTRGQWAKPLTTRKKMFLCDQRELVTMTIEEGKVHFLLFARIKEKKYIP